MNKLLNFWKNTKYESSWKIFFRHGNPGSILSDKKSIFYEYKIKGRFWGADPLLFRFGNSLFCFFELYDEKLKKGSIAYFEFNNNTPTDYKIVLSCDYHLSFPFVFTFKDRFFMIPETGAVHSLLLFESRRFPETWEEIKVLKTNINSSDSVVLANEFYNTIFASVMDGCASFCHNNIYFLDDSMNVVEELLATNPSNEGARNAGGFFYFNKQLFRVGQYCKNNNYGEGLAFFAAFFDEQRHTYKEELIDVILPSDLIFENNKKYRGIHTYSSNCDIEIIDAKVIKKRHLVKRLFLLFGAAIKKIYEKRK